MITEQVKEIAYNLLSSSPLRDPCELSIALVEELVRLDVIGSDESAENIDFSSLISTLLEGLADSTYFDVAVLGEIRTFFTNKGRIESLFCGLLRSSQRSGARSMEIRCSESEEAWSFVVRDDGNLISSSQRRAMLELAYEVSETGKPRVGDVALFTALQILRFYEGEISVSPFGAGGSEVRILIPKE
jgi:signal transduction histidine kinase